MNNILRIVSGNPGRFRKIYPQMEIFPVSPDPFRIWRDRWSGTLVPWGDSAHCGVFEIRMSSEKMVGDGNESMA